MFFQTFLNKDVNVSNFNVIVMKYIGDAIPVLLVYANT